MPPRPTTDFRSFYLLNVTQFLGALNDNIFKLLVIFFLMDLKGAQATNTILSIAGAIFVVPFLLFSSASGVLADRIRKNSILVSMKGFEVIIMACSILAIYIQSPFFSYFLLFLMGTQSAVFGPSKYGIIPELVAPDYVSKANGSITSLTYLAIICGTFLASFITERSGGNFYIGTGFCTLIAFLGFISSLGIRKTIPRGSKKRINPFFVYEIYQSLSLSLKRPFLFPSILGVAFFLFIGAYIQLNIIPFAMESLDLSKEQGGYLFLATAVGIAIGAKIAGRISKHKIELGSSSLAGFLIVFIFLAISLFSTHLYLIILLLVLLGVFGGMFLIPMESFIQVSSPDKRRGQIIAASNFLSFGGVLLAAFVLYLFNEKWGFSAAQSFALIAFMTLIFQSIITGRMTRHLLVFLTEKIFPYFYKLEWQGDKPPVPAVILTRKCSFWEVVLSAAFYKKIKVLVLARPFTKFPWINGFVQGFRIISPSHGVSASLNRFFSQSRRPCSL
jgi:acyl-[acyl-carrier-protein]-phospholipid O-acyltransferase / long-chain-fatty-acid--[acyl-carrier-protein] ligase